MKNYSIWNEYKSKTKCNTLESDIETDILIVGGGITGLSILEELKAQNLNCILIERNECGRGVTSRSTAKITYLQEKILMNIRTLVSVEAADKYLKSQILAINKIKELITKNNIACDFKEVDSYLFTNDENNISKLEEEYNFLIKNNIDVSKITKPPFKESCKLALKVPNTYVFHPLKYLDFWKNKYQKSMYEHTKLESINKKNNYYECYANNHLIKAKYLIIATHYPYFLTPFCLPIKSHIETSYIGASKTTNFKNISAINIDKPTISLRYHEDNPNNYLIYLKNSYISSNITNIKDNFNKLTDIKKFNYLWSNKDIITNDYMPYIGSITKDNTFLIACGYNTWGMTNSILASIIIKDIILKKDNPYISLFSPKRNFNLSKLIRFPIDIKSNIKAIIKSTKNNVNNSQVIYTKRNNQNVAIYKDEKNNEHIVLNKCPHLKCGLVFNEIEKTWDCLCHGSRFNIDGKCIEGPSNYDITFKE